MLRLKLKFIKPTSAVKEEPQESDKNRGQGTEGQQRGDQTFSKENNLPKKSYQENI